jgi:hypothetical protein
MKHYRYNPDEVRRAKPLISEEQIRNGFTHPGTKLLFIVLGVGGVFFYVSNLETVPVSGRRRFNCYSEESVEAEGQMMYKMIMQDNRDSILPAWDPRTRMVERVMTKLIPASGLENVNVRTRHIYFRYWQLLTWAYLSGRFMLSSLMVSNLLLACSSVESVLMVPQKPTPSSFPAEKSLSTLVFSQLQRMTTV